MDNCNNLIHPFQNDPGVSQRQRVISDLLSGSAKIDGRSMADLLEYFLQLSKQVKYYDSSLNVSDWHPFFSKSVPFTLASVVRYNKTAIQRRFTKYNTLFNKKPSRYTIQLLIHYIYNQTIQRINLWHGEIKGSELSAESTVEKLIKDKLSVPVKNFICLANYASRKYAVKKIDISKLYENEAWNLVPDKIADSCRIPKASTKRKRLIALRDEIVRLFPGFLSVIDIAGRSAESSIEQSLFPLKEELQKKHPPHLAVLFAFLKLFTYLQSDLNSFTKKHLDFFYQDVLKIKPRNATADKTHILFAIQKQLDKYLLKKGIQLKDGKDNKKAEIYFGSDDEIVVNKTEVADVRTLFLNNKVIFDAKEKKKKSYIEGIYMAPDARKADGVKIDFKDDAPKNWPTLGNKLSKYVDPERKYYKPYPKARIGFILASPVLLLNEGERDIKINLACELQKDVCDFKKVDTGAGNKCCEEHDTANLNNKSKDERTRCKERGEIDQLTLDSLRSEDLPTLAARLIAFYGLLNSGYYYFNEELIDAAAKNGLGKDIIDVLRGLLIERNRLTREKPRICYCPQEKHKYGVLFKDSVFKDFLGEVRFVNFSEFFKPIRLLKVSFSGKDDWIESDPVDTTIQLAFHDAQRFTLKINTKLHRDKPGVTFFDKEKLKEDYDTTMPLVKIELDDRVKLLLESSDSQNPLSGFIIKKNMLPNPATDICCLEFDTDLEENLVSFYQFFRDVVIKESIGNKTTINVSVCGLKNFIVQNDESVMDVNAPIYPWGARPNVIDFDINAPKIYVVTQDFINALTPPGIHNDTKTFLQGLITPASPMYRVGTTKAEVEAFLLRPQLNTATTIGDKPTLRALFFNPLKDFSNINLVGPNFYIGSQEIFCKKWDDVYINLNWKDKPSNFNEYYKAYWVDPDDPTRTTFGLYEDKFEINIALLQDLDWKKEKVWIPPPPPIANGAVVNPVTHDANRKLFHSDATAGFCTPPEPYEQTIHVAKEYINGINSHFSIKPEKLVKYDVNTTNGFLRINLQNQDFLHKDYAFILARQMMAQGKLPNEHVEGAVYFDKVSPGTGPIVISTTDMLNSLIGSAWIAREVNVDVNTIKTNTPNSGSIPNPPNANNIRAALNNPAAPNIPAEDINLIDGADHIDKLFNDANPNIGIIKKLQNIKQYGAIIPNEPWPPIIKNISLDYTATAFIQDIDLIHLYPYDGTYKQEDIQETPTLFPTFCDEGTMYVGLKGLVTGSNLNVLFQLAEATADSELEREDVNWHYLDNNEWKSLRKGFEVIDDATNGLTTSGIVKFALPENMTNDNTILPKGLHWIKASIVRNSASVSETIGIHPQAIQVVFTNDELNDKLRLDQALPAGSISKLKEADANVKSVEQPYDSFGGREPEVEKHYYVRVSEILRHKNRAIQKWDYERILLEAFPQIYKTKCINHSFALNAHQYKNDFPMAPGYVILAVIPDLTKLKAGNSFQPKAPVSLLEEIEEYMRKKTSPFVRLRAMNPRYEKVDFCLKVKLYKGKDENYYKEQLKEDIREFLAPWAIGEYSKLSFGQGVTRSDLVRFIDGLDYVDYILELKMHHELDPGTVNLTDPLVSKVCPKTPRSILIAGEIDVCIKQDDCSEWKTNETNLCKNEPIPVLDFCK